jgi:hypothetical protein
LRVRLNIVGSHSGRQHPKRDASEKMDAQGESNVCASSEVQPAIQFDRMNLNIMTVDDCLKFVSAEFKFQNAMIVRDART